jgi:hypothetical protein
LASADLKRIATTFFFEKNCKKRNKTAKFHK